MNIRRFDANLDLCKACNEYLVELGVAPGCPGCDGQLLRKQVGESQQQMPMEVELTRTGAITWRHETAGLR